MTQALRAAGHEVHIVTDFDEHYRQQRERELAAYGISYDALVITADKLAYCRANDIAVAIDDDNSYFAGSATPVPVSLFRFQN